MSNLKIDLSTVPQTTNDWQDLKHLLAQAVRETHAKFVLETGTDVGDSTRLFSSLLQETDGHIWTVDIAPPKNDWAAHWPIKNVTFVQGDSRQLRWSQKIDLLFLDGDHTYEAVSTELKLLAPCVRAGGKVLLHDPLHQEYGPNILRAVHEWSVAVRMPWTLYPYQHGLAVIEVTHELPILPPPVVVAGSPRPQ